MSTAMVTTRSAPNRLLTAEEYSELSDLGDCTELVRGEVVEMTPPGVFHGFVIVRITFLITHFNETAGLGRATSESGVITERGPDTVRGPDVSYYSFKRLPVDDYPVNGYAQTTPEMVFEVLSPSNTPSEVREKIAEYIAVGIRVVCVVDPVHRTAIIHRKGADPVTLEPRCDFEVPDIIPGFRVPLALFFSERANVPG